MNLQVALLKMFLKRCYGQRAGFRDEGKSRRAGSQGAHQLEVICLIRSDLKHSAGGESAVDRFEKFFCNDAPRTMTPFRPRIGEQQMKPVNGFRRKKMANGIGTFDAQNARVAQLALRDFSTGAAHPSEQTFRAEKIPMSILLCERGEEGPVPTTEVNFQGRNASEDSSEIERCKIIWRDKLDGRSDG